MIEFPKIKKADLYKAYENLVDLYVSNLPDIVRAAESITAGQPNNITYSAGTIINTQIGQIKNRIGRTADKEGQTLFIQLIEKLYDDLTAAPVAGISTEDFLFCTELIQEDSSKITYTSRKIWNWVWELTFDEDTDQIEMCVRGKGFPTTEVVPHYILNNFKQAIIAYNNNTNGAALSLLSISLEGVLRDALFTKGYIYNSHIPTQDRYSKSNMNISPLEDGYKVIFPEGMPKSHADLGHVLDGDENVSVKIKRVKWNGDWVLQIFNIDELSDFWSSNIIEEHGQKKIGGLGTALSVARDDEDIIDISIFPSDFDRPIQAVRNNLIHLSGSAMEEVVHSTGSVTYKLKDYINNKGRVYDATTSIGRLINDLYFKISNNSL